MKEKTSTVDMFILMVSSGSKPSIRMLINALHVIKLFLFLDDNPLHNRMKVVLIIDLNP